MKHKARTKALSILLSLTLMLGLGPGMSMTALADNTETLLATITASAKEQASYNPENVATVSFTGQSNYTNNGTTNWGWWGYGITITVTPAEGYTITKCVFYDESNRTATDSEAPFVVETAEEDKTPRVNGTPILANQSIGITKIEVYGYATPAADTTSTYTLTIPSTLSVAHSGWNATDGISATGTLADGKKLTVTASSDNEFALVNQSDNTQKVNYKLATASTDTEATTSWEFDSLSSTATTKPMGIIVEDYSTKPAGTYQDTVTFTANVEDAGPAWNTVDLSSLTGDYTAQNYDLLTGTLSGNYKISIADGATVMLKDVNITNLGNLCDWAGINCPGDATLVLDGTNTVCAGRDDEGLNNYPGIWISEDKTLTIQGTGILTAYSNATNPFGAGIGGGFDISCGNISISGGNITATGGYNAAGIGGSNGSTCGSITISGGTITAMGGENAAGIGGGSYQSTCGDITITDGVTQVTASKVTGAANSIGRGSGRNDACGTVTIGGTVGAITESPYTYTPN